MTLSNVYSGMVYVWIRHLTMWTATVVLLLYIIKIIKYPKTCLSEYQTVVPCSLYAGFTMVMMILGSYYFDYAPGFGKALWSIGLAVHAVHILVFTFRNVIKERNINTFVPSWFVTYNGIMVSCVVGGARVQQILSTVLNERYSETLNVMTSGTGIMRVLVNLVPAALALIQYKVCGIRDKRDAQIANIFLIDAAINICSLNSSYFARMSIYFALFIAAYYPRVIHKTFNTRSQVIAYTFFIAFYTLFYLYQAYTFASYGYMREFHLVI